ncbi:MAG: alpha-L-rhamnosidase C-terminal domain-containing protein [Planctomycetaceae bacterium]
MGTGARVVSRSASAIGVLALAIGGMAAAADRVPAAGAARPAPARVVARAPLVTTPEEPRRVVRAADGRLFLDFGTAAFAWLRLEFSVPAPDLGLEVRLGEKRGAGDAVDPNPGGSVAYQDVHVDVAAGTREVDVVPAWRPKYANWVPTPDGFPEVAPFRYVEILGLPPAATVPPRIVRMARHVPFDADAAAFSCSDPALVEVWDLCKHSIKATSFLGLYVDGNRERIPYEADAFINQLCHYAVDAHYITGRLTYEHLLDHATWPTEWRQHVPLMAWADWLYSGDDAALERNYERIRSSAMLERRRPDGLFHGRLEGVPRDIVDWPAGERDDYDMTTDVKTVTSAFHARSLEALAAIATATGRDAEAREFTALRQATIRALRDRLFDEVRGVYVDGLHAATGDRSGHASLHANMLPLAFELVPAADVERVADFVAGRGMACSVYGAQYLLDGLFQVGRADEALALLTATGDRGWLHMSRDLGSTITLEAWDAVYKPNLDWNHAWGAVPANVIPRRLMGIEPSEPGFRRIVVRPCMGPLAWARIRHPSPLGPIELAMTNDRRGWRADLDLPPGMVAEVHVPTGDPRRFRVLRGTDEVAAPVLRIAAGRCVAEVASGRSTFSVMGQQVTDAVPAAE